MKMAGGFSCSSSLSSFDGLRMRGVMVEGLEPNPLPHAEPVEASLAIGAGDKGSPTTLADLRTRQASVERRAASPRR
jgi:hypothetical protein